MSLLKCDVLKILIGMITMFFLSADVVAQLVTVEPSPLIFRAPFRVSTTDSTLSSVFLSTLVSCGDIVGTSVTISGGVATIPSPPSDSEVLYLCNSLTASLIRELVFERVAYRPPYLFLNEPSVLRFSAATPTGSNVQLRLLSDCTQGSASHTETVPSSLEVVFTATTAVYYFVCVQFVSTITSQLVTINAGPLIVTSRVNFIPKEGITNENVTFETFEASPPNTRVKLSSNQDCLDVLQGPNRTGGPSGKLVAMRLAVPRGTYAFCVETPLNSEIFVPAGDLVVSQFAITPPTILASLATTMRAALDTPFGTQAALTMSPTCAEPFILGPTVIGPGTGMFSWTISNSGIFNACVLKPSTTTQFVLANEIRVLVTYVVTAPTSPVARGLPLTINVREITGAAVSLAHPGTCTPIVSGVTDTSGNWTTIIPIGATLSFSSFTVCVKVPDNSSEYQLAQVGLRAFHVAHGALIAGIQATIVIDEATPTNAVARLAPNMSCTEGSDFVIADERHLTTTFAESTTESALCLRTVGTVFTFIRTFVIRAQVTAGPLFVLANIPITIRFSNVFAGQTVFVTSLSCSEPRSDTVNETASGAGHVNVSLTWSHGASHLSLCAVYETSTGHEQPEAVSTLTIQELTHSPSVFIVSRNSRVEIRGSYVGGFGSSAYLGAASAPCAAAAPPDAVQGNLTLTTDEGDENESAHFTFTPVRLGDMRLCVEINDGRFLGVGVLTIIEPMPIAIVSPLTEEVLRGLPLRFSLTEPYIPSRFVLSDSEECASEDLSGTFDSVSGVSSVVVPHTAGMYTLCVSSDDGITLLPVSPIAVTSIVATSTTLINGQNATLHSEPSLPPGNFSFRLASSPSCESPVLPGLPLQVPVGTYHVCALLMTPPAGPPLPPGGADFFSTASNNTIAVVSGFGIVVPATVRAHVPARYLLSGGDVSLLGPPNAMFFVPTTAPCASPPPSELFTFNQVSNTTDAVVSTPAGELVDICVLTRDRTSSFRAASVNPLPYMSPSSLVKGTARDVVSGALQGGVGKISADAACSSALWGPTAMEADVHPRVVVPESAGSSGFLCEAIDSSLLWVNRGSIAFLSPFNPNVSAPPEPTPVPQPGATPAPGTEPPTFAPGTDGGIRNATVPPGTPFEVVVDPAAGRDPFLSRFENCTDPVNVEGGYVPAEGEVSLFFVCITSPDGSLVYTNRYPSINVTHYRVQPTAVRAISAQEPISLLPSSPASATVYISTERTCTPRIGPLSLASGTTAQVNLTGIPGGVNWFCVRNNEDRFVAVASFLVVDAPEAISVSQSLAGIPICITVEVLSGSYSLQSPAVDASFPTARYFLTTRRGLFLVRGDGTACRNASAPSTPLQQQLVSSYSPMHSTCLQQPTGNERWEAGSRIAVCAETPAGPLAVAKEPLFLANVAISPTEFVAGAVRRVTVSNVAAGTVLGISANDSCALLVSPAFAVEGGGFGQLSTIGRSEAGQPFFIAAQDYSLCLQAGDGNFYAVSSLRVTRPQYFAVSQLTFIAGVPTTVALLQDLMSANLLPGMYADETCGGTPVNNSEWAEVVGDSRSIVVTIANTTAPAFLCARAPVNGTFISVASFMAQRLSIQFPTRAAVCSPFTIGVPSNAAAEHMGGRFVLADRACCAGPLGAENVAAEAVASQGMIGTSTTVYTMLVDSNVMDVFSPRTNFNLCFLGLAGACLQLGVIDLSARQCDTESPGSAIIIPPDSTGFIGGAAPREKNRDITALPYLIIAFIIVVVLALLVCVIHSVIRGNKVVPVDGGDVPTAWAATGDGGDGGDGDEQLWKRTFDELFSSNRLRGPRASVMHSVLNVPVDMHLGICRELPLCVQELLGEETSVRDAIIASEELVWQQLMQSYANETMDVHSYMIAVERAQRTHELLEYIDAQLDEMESGEQHDRHRLLLDEEEARLRVAELERALWREEMELEGQRLRLVMEHDPYWRQRRERLREVSSHALLSVSRGAGPPGNENSRTPLPGQMPAWTMQQSPIVASRRNDVMSGNSRQHQPPPPSAVRYQDIMTPFSLRMSDLGSGVGPPSATRSTELDSSVAHPR